MQINPPYLMFLGDVPDKLAAKTAYGIVDWRRDWCLGQVRLPGCKADLGIPDMSVKDAAAKGAKTLVVGIVNAGGVLNEAWIPTIIEALESGMDVASGLHIRLGTDERIATAAQKHGRALHDVRMSDQRFATGKGTKRPGLRLLTVGTDCSVGKKYTVLAMEKAMRDRGLDADFRATGQTGVFISGRGVAIDAVVADFISGAVEWISPAGSPGHWDLVEGQGSLFHPSFSGVTMGLLHGAQPDAFVVCHEPTRTTMRGVQHPLPTIQEVIDLTIQCGKLTNPAIKPVGISVNTQALGEEEAKTYLAGLEKEHGLPATDPIRFGVEGIVDRVLADFPATKTA
ncbi:N-acetyltransferase DgcN [Enterovirga rhinocerotis]|uniref:Putative NAD-dependent epimerase/dehydratase family protein n=1 Tax=Enterovirga rhinocerotis TaxID=1339210 RepID=A0A4R7C5P0_9HYPH|nr:N-acetyltransferase DgcN [Enterovirga rhinocerotis]TDR93874.1 putative NAD-dependent epimerase/dehydratase family protein [Enterovirga rhinocerotis]